MHDLNLKLAKIYPHSELQCWNLYNNKVFIINNIIHSIIAFKIQSYTHSRTDQISVFFFQNIKSNLRIFFYYFHYVVFLSILSWAARVFCASKKNILTVAAAAAAAAPEVTMPVFGIFRESIIIWVFTGFGHYSYNVL